MAVLEGRARRAGTGFALTDSNVEKVADCDSYRCTYGSGRTGGSCHTGFAVRGKALVICLVAESPAQQDLLARQEVEVFGERGV